MREIDAVQSIDLYLSGHTGINILIYPWSYTNDGTPDDAMYERMGVEVAAATGVAYGQASNELYIATGTSKDFGYGEIGAPSFTYEVDDQQNRLGTYQMTIAERLREEVATCVFLIERVALFRANLDVSDTRVVERAGAKLLQVEVENVGWTAAVNASVSVGLSDGRVVSGPSTFTIDADNATTLEFEVEAGGVQDVSVQIVYQELQVNVSDTNTTTVVESVDFGAGSLGAIVAAGGSAVLLIAVAGAVLFIVDRRTGGRIGARARPAMRAVKARLGRRLFSRPGLPPAPPEE
jgi:hypothetical protein